LDILSKWIFRFLLTKRNIFKQYFCPDKINFLFKTFAITRCFGLAPVSNGGCLVDSNAMVADPGATNWTPRLLPCPDVCACVRKDHIHAK
jgi:hypothetical protein